MALTAPVTTQLHRILDDQGVDLNEYPGLVTHLMHFIYDQREAAVSEILDTYKNKHVPYLKI